MENSKEKVYIEVYMFTEKRIKSAVKKAFQNGVEVKILLEKDPYMAYSINDNFYNEFVKESINVKWSDTKDYALNHSKFMIIDDLAIISTGNLTYSTFTKNRDFFVITKDKKIVSDLIKLFNYDYS
ncbi:MAG: phospholipase D-like domain-containing protein [Patescibacteria group bacterium]|nr:phospholipase D-like domain-containing protein [Patescibacteria group bacterium]